MKKDVLANDGLPPKREVVVYAGMTTMQRGYYDLVGKNALRETLVSPWLVVGRWSLAVGCFWCCCYFVVLLYRQSLEEDCHTYLGG